MTGYRSKNLLSKGREVDLSGQRDKRERDLVDQIIALQKDKMLCIEIIQMLGFILKEYQENIDDGSQGETKERQ